MNTVEETMSAIRVVESEGSYEYQRNVMVGGVRDRKVGAYGILESKWPVIADSLGYSGADWRDPQVQDLVVKELLSMHYKETGSWEQAAASLRFGGAAVRAMRDQGYIEPKSIEEAGLKPLGEYIRNLRGNVPSTTEPVMGSVQPRPGVAQSDPTQRRAENILRQQVVGMRNAQKKGVNPSGNDINVEPVGDQGVPDPTE